MLFTLLSLLSLATANPLVNPGPVMKGVNFPDVNIQWSDGRWWAFATRTANSSVNAQLAVSADYKSWELFRDSDGNQWDPLPNLPSWVKHPNIGVWDPDVVKLDNGSWVMYIAASVKGRGSAHCLMAATADRIQGPYQPIDQDHPWICPKHSNGAFGVSGFKDWEVKGDWELPPSNSYHRNNCIAKNKESCHNSYVDERWSEGGHGGRRYVVYKIQNADGSRGKQTKTPLALQEVDASNGYTLIGEPVMLLDNDGKADEHSIEGPTLFKTCKGRYVLFFSTGNTVLPHYTTSYAVADNLTGPFVRKGALLKTGDSDLISPGAADVSWDGRRMVFHALPSLPFDHMREMYAAEISIDDSTGDTEVLQL